MAKHQRSKSGLSFKTAAGAEIAECDAIFPIVRVAADKFDVVGTGFYISIHGVFVTATHCFEHEGKIASDHGFMIMHFAPGDVYIQRPILRAWHSAKADVSVGVAAAVHHNETRKPLAHTAMTLTASRPPVGSQIATFAFGGTRVERDGAKHHVHLAPKFYEGRLIDYFPNGRDRSMIPWPVYETSMTILGGASGGPVVDETGATFAINTSGVDGQADVSYVTPIDFILDGEVSGAVLPPDTNPRSYTVRELAKKGMITFRPDFPSR